MKITNVNTQILTLDNFLAKWGYSMRTWRKHKETQKIDPMLALRYGLFSVHCALHVESMYLKGTVS